MLQLPDLVYGPSCSTLSAVDRAIMIERELEDLADARDVELADVRIDLQEAREERDEQSHAAEELAAALDAVIDGGGTVTHHHSVGRDHRPWYDRQRPDGFAAALAAAKAALDPAGVLNPGVLIGPETRLGSGTGARV